jgi:hypothetical protein
MLRLQQGFATGGIGSNGHFARANNPQDPMSALGRVKNVHFWHKADIEDGQKQTLGRVRLMSALPRKADINSGDAATITSAVDDCLCVPIF